MENQTRQMRRIVQALILPTVFAAGITNAQAQATSEAAPSPAELKRRLEILSEEVNRMKIGESDARADRSDWGMGAAASKIYRAERGVSIGGYGEFIFTHAGRVPANATREPDVFNFARAVLYFGYKFDDDWLWNSEFEVENATTEATGSVNMEFGYLDRLLSPALNLRFGSVLIPMGFINEIHEPTFFLGAKRPEVEQRLIPSTWSENGFGLFGSIGPFSYKSYVVAGLNASNFEDSGIREGRQGSSESNATTWATTVRFDYTGISGVTIGSSAYIGSASTEQAPDKGGGRAIPLALVDAHAEWRAGNAQVRALVVRTRIDRVAELNQARNLSAQESIGSSQMGQYLELGYDIWPGPKGRSVVPFLRWEQLDTQDAVPDGYDANPENDVSSLTVGANYKPIDQIVFKIDYRSFDDKTVARTRDEYNAAIGYVF